VNPFAVARGDKSVLLLFVYVPTCVSCIHSEVDIIDSILLISRLFIFIQFAF